MTEVYKNENPLAINIVMYNPDDTVDKSTEVGPIIRSRFRVQRDLEFRKSKMEKSLRFWQSELRTEKPTTNPT